MDDGNTGAEVSFSKGIGGLPLVALFEQALERDIELPAALGDVFPNGRLDVSKADLVNRLTFAGITFLSLWFPTLMNKPP